MYQKNLLLLVVTKWRGMSEAAVLTFQDQIVAEVLFSAKKNFFPAFFLNTLTVICKANGIV